MVRMLETVAQERRYPEAIQVDNGPEFISRAVDQWAYVHGVALHFIDGMLALGSNGAGRPNSLSRMESVPGRATSPV